MARGNFTQTSFVGGEWSKAAQGMFTTPDYFEALDFVENYVALPAGSVVRRPGFIRASKQASKPIKLFDFVPDTRNSLTVELTAGRLRFYSQGELLSSLSTAVTAINAPLVTVASVAGLAVGQSVYFVNLDQAGKNLANRVFKIDNIAGNDLTLSDENGGQLSAADAAAGSYTTTQLRVVQEQTVPFLANEVQDVWADSERNFLHLHHVNHEGVIIRQDDLTPTTVEYRDGPYLAINKETTSLVVTGTTGTVTLTFSDTLGIDGGQGFTVDDIGRHIRVSDASNNWWWVVIDSVTSPTVVTAVVQDGATLGTIDPQNWRLGRFCKKLGYISTFVFARGRKWAASNKYPGEVVATKIATEEGDYSSWSPTDPNGVVQDNSAITLPIGGGERKRIQWIEQGPFGVVFATDGAEYAIRASSLDNPLTAFSAEALPRTGYGANPSKPVRVGTSLVYPDPLGRTIRDFFPNSEFGYSNEDATRFALHLTKDGVAEVVYAKSPYEFLYARKEDGTMLTATITVADRRVRQSRFGWQRMKASSGKAVSMAVVPFSDRASSRNDTLWVAFDDGEFTYVEYQTPVYDESINEADTSFMDGSVTYKTSDRDITWSDDGNGNYTFAGLQPYEGQEVALSFRGAYIGLFTVNNAEITAVISADLESYYPSFVELVNFYYTQGGTFTQQVWFTKDRPGLLNQKLRPPINGSDFVVGEDGKEYHTIYTDLSYSFIVEKVTGNFIAKGKNEIMADALSLGLNSDGLAGQTGIRGVILPVVGTQYLIGLTISDISSRIHVFVVYYKIDNTGAMVPITGFREYSGFGLDNAVGLDAGGLAGVSFDYTDIGGPFNSDMRPSLPILAIYRGVNASKVVRLPSVVEAIATGIYLTDEASDYWSGRAQEMDTGSFGSILDARYPGTPNEYDVTITGVPDFSTGQGRTKLIVWVNTNLMQAFAAGTATQPSPMVTAVATPTSVGTMFSGYYDRTQFNSETWVEDVNFLSPDDAVFTPSAHVIDPLDPRAPQGLLAVSPDATTNGLIHTDLSIYDAVKGKAVGASTRQSNTMFDPVALGTNNKQLTMGAGHWNAATGEMTYFGYVRPFSNTYLYAVLAAGIEAVFSELVPNPAFEYIEAYVGLAYESRLRLLRPGVTAGARNGETLAKLRRIDRYGLMLWNTAKLYVGTDSGAFFTNPSTVVPNNPAMTVFERFKGVTEGTISDRYDYEGQIEIYQDEPYPAMISAISGFSNVQDK